MSETLRDGTKNEFTYDGFGNRTSVKTTKNGQTTETKASYNVYNQLTSMGNESFTYDKNGNRLTDGTYSYTWDAADQMTAVTKKGETKPFLTYTYDEDGRRIQKRLVPPLRTTITTATASTSFMKRTVQTPSQSRTRTPTQVNSSR